ncbi:MAG: hypothetical protein IPO98_03515 [Saprospiraceae bacterium]|nr:hypothetical protein [Saprospiraceae bacterium]
MEQNKLLAGCLFFILTIISVQNSDARSYLQREDIWVRAKMAEMSIDQKIGQIFMVRAYSRGSTEEEKIISDYIKNYYIGGICFFQGSPKEQVNLINKFQSQAKTPMFMGIDGEWGLAMRFPKEAIAFPKQMMLGAIRDNKLIYEMGREIARQCKKSGININFAPSVDINSNPLNPVIFDRSFGESPENVTSKGYMMMKAMEDEGIMACVKHFPGHGDTDIDSHNDLPVVNYGLDRLERYEFYPFRRLASQGVSAMMIGHLQAPQLDDRPNRPATLSKNIIGNIVRDDMSFNGLLITDAMDMKGITKYWPNGEAEAEAFMAGNDVILLPENLPKAFQTIKEYISSGKITLSRLDESLERILRAKYKIGLNTNQIFETNGINEFLSRNQSLAIKQKLAEAAITLVSDDHNLIPIKDIVNVNVATLSLNSIQKTKFQSRIDDYVIARHYQLLPNQLPAKQSQLFQTLGQFDKVIVGIHTSGKIKDFTSNLSPEMIGFLKELNTKTEVIFVLFGSPYLLKNLDFAGHIIEAYDNDPLTQDVAAQSLFGVSDINGLLPVSVDDKWQVGYGLERKV